MTPLHTIRLAGPWEVTPLVRHAPDAAGRWGPVAGPLPAAARQTLPGDWSAALGPEFYGRVALTRGFHWVAPLVGGERVWLVVERVRGRAEIALDGHPLGTTDSSGGGAAFDVTERLARRNTLRVTVEWPAIDPATGAAVDDAWRGEAGGGLVGEVRLEVRRG